MKLLFTLLIAICCLSSCKKEPVAVPEIKPIAATDPVKVIYSMKPKVTGGTLKSATNNFSEFTVTDYVGYFNTLHKEEERSVSLYITTLAKSHTIVRQRPAKGTKLIFRGLQNMTGGNLIVSIEVGNNIVAYADVEPNADGVAEFNLAYTF
jgi:hypothetical protein